jgi:hypothetical protein
VVGTEKRNFLMKSVISQVGKGTSDPGTGDSGNGRNTAQGPNPVHLREVRRPPRCINTNEVLEKLQEGVTGYPGVVVHR